jgi:hypothetical protein
MLKQLSKEDFGCWDIESGGNQERREEYSWRGWRGVKESGNSRVIEKWKSPLNREN